MIRRFRLERKSEYEKLVIAQRLAEMLDKFLMGRPAPLAIGAEQGGIEEWDDVVIMHTPDSFEHLQIKRQTTHFCTKNSDKTKASSRKAKDDSSDNTPADSVLDKAFASLAGYAVSGKLNLAPDRIFKLTLLGAHLQIKDELTVNHLDELCNLCRQDGLSLTELASRSDGPTQRAYKWLTTWCGFNDWGHVRDVLRRVYINCIGNDAALKSYTCDLLGRYFRDPQRTLERLITYISAETSDVSALGCHAALRALRDELRSDIETWAQYQLSDASSGGIRSWSLSGTHDLMSLTPRSARGVVEHMWNEQYGDRKLRIYAPLSTPLGASLTLPSAIIRMALHLTNGSKSLVLDESMWRNTVGYEIGHTLGSSEDDFREVLWLENTERLKCAQDYEFRTHIEARKEAEALAEAMDDVLWQRVEQGILEKLNSIPNLDLVEAMEIVWRTWQSGFNANPESRRAFMEQLLYPKTERKNEMHALRLGLRTVKLLITAVETLLLVAVGFSRGNNTWKSFQEGGSVLSIALKYWSGPPGATSDVRALSDDPLLSVIGSNPDPIVILSGVNASPSELLNLDMADDAETATSMAAARQPHLLITRSGVYQQLRKGTLESVRQHFSKQWQERQLARESAIKKNTKGD